MPPDDNTDQTRAPRLVLKTSGRNVAIVVAPPLLFASLLLYRGGILSGQFGWNLVIAGPLLALAVFSVFALRTMRLVADEQGIVWSGLGKTRHMGWNDITEIGVARDRTAEGSRHPIARLLTGGRWRPAPDKIGITLKADRSQEGAGTRAYLMGFTGYEVNIPGYFDRSVEDIVIDLNVRLAAAREELTTATSQ